MLLLGSAPVILSWGAVRSQLTLRFDVADTGPLKVVVPLTPTAPLIATPVLNVVLAPLTLSGALISISRVPVPYDSNQFTAPVANLSVENLIGCAAFVAKFKPPL